MYCGSELHALASTQMLIVAMMVTKRRSDAPGLPTNRCERQATRELILVFMDTRFPLATLLDDARLRVDGGVIGRERERLRRL
jgi:hypothetical protein